MQDSAESETSLGKVLIKENSNSGEYVSPTFSNKLHICSVLVKINNAT